MKQLKSKCALLSASLLLAVGGLINIPTNYAREVEPFNDNAVYDLTKKAYDYDEPYYEEDSSSSTQTVDVSKVVIYFYCNDGDNNLREIYLWGKGFNGRSLVSNVDDSTMFHAEMSLSAYTLYEVGFLVKYKSKWEGQSEDAFINFNTYKPDKDGVVTVYSRLNGSQLQLFSSEEEVRNGTIQTAEFTDWKTIKVTASEVATRYEIYAFEKNYLLNSEFYQENKKATRLIKMGNVDGKTFTVKSSYDIGINIRYLIKVFFDNGYYNTKIITMNKLYNTDAFKQYYNYDGDDLGVTYSDKSSTFKLWAPTSARVDVKIYDGDDFKLFPMSFRQGGIWECEINGNLDGLDYNYICYNSNGKVEAVDPYAKAATHNGYRGSIVDFSKTNPTGWDEVPSVWNNVLGYDIATPNQLSIYETHIRDLTMDSTWTGNSMRGTFNAFSEPNTTYSNGVKTVKTGFDHIEEMGYNAVHLLPVFDSDNEEQVGGRSYNWGYNPLNYNCVEGAYSTNPNDAKVRIQEYKNLVKAYAGNANHTRIIMDVVYNHVSDAPTSCFEKIMPGYYFRMDDNGNYYNGSGCGNEVKTEAPMMSKYIVDSLCWWAKEYKIKGFRFDLMGLINIATIDAARKALYQIDPDILLYGEGWTGDGSGYNYGTKQVQQVHGNRDLADDPDNPNKLSKDDRDLLGSVTAAVYRYLYPVNNACYVAAFNDAGRNALKGGNNLENEGWGFIDQGSEHVGDKSTIVTDMMAGYHRGFGGNPNQCVNYVSCHDNYALFDQFQYAVSGATYDSPGLACAAVSAVECAIAFSNGIALFAGGEELFRSKEVIEIEDLNKLQSWDYSIIQEKTISHNSYNLSDAVNAFKWDRKISINGVDTSGYIENMAKAIKLRSSLPKYSYDDFVLNPPYSSESDFNFWGNGDDSTVVAIRNNGYFCFISGCNDDIIPFGAYYVGVDKVAFTSNKTNDYDGFEPAGKGDNKGIKLGWHTTVCLY